MSPSSLLAALLAAGALVAGSETGARADCPRESMRWASSSNRLYVTGPVACTLTDLDTVSPATALQLVDAAGKIWLLRANLFLQQGATLLLHGDAAGGDAGELRLLSNDAPGGTIFIRAEWGAIDMDHTRVLSWDETAAAPDTRPESNGRAFIQVRSRLDPVDGTTPRVSRMDVRDSDVGYLGHDAAESYGLVWKVYGTPTATLYDEVDVLGDITNSRIHHNYFGVYTYGAYGMTIDGNEFDSNVKYGLDPHDDSDFLTITNNASHDNGNHGIICSQRCDHLIIRGNRVYANVGHGIMIHRRVTDTIVEDNEVRDNTDAGIAVFDSYGNTIRNNVVSGNASGIRLSVGSTDNLIEGNDVSGSRAYGLYFYKGSDAPTSGDGRNRRNTFQGNHIHGNAMALRMSDSDENQLLENVFEDNEAGFLFHDSVDNVLSGNQIPTAALVMTETSPGGEARTIIAGAMLSLLIENEGAAQTIFRETGIRTHKAEGLTLATTIAPTESTLVLDSSQTSPARRVYSYSMYGRPSSGTLELTPTAKRAWRSRSPSGTVTVGYRVGLLTAGASYTVLRDGVPWKTLTASSTTSAITFTDTNDETTVTYSVVDAG